MGGQHNLRSTESRMSNTDHLVNDNCRSKINIVITEGLLFFSALCIFIVFL